MCNTLGNKEIRLSEGGLTPTVDIRSPYPYSEQAVQNCPSAHPFQSMLLLRLFLQCTTVLIALPNLIAAIRHGQYPLAAQGWQQYPPLLRHGGFADADSDALGKKPLFSLHRSLIDIDSTSGREHDVAIWLESYLTAHNFTVEKQAVEPLPDSNPTQTPQRYNILAYPGLKRKTRVLLSSHIDTVPPFIPYSIRNGNEIWGRGSVDDKACVAAQITAVLELLSSDSINAEGDVSLLFVVGEEVSGDGMRAANALNLSWESVIFGEPTELKLVSGHKGVVSFSVKARGKSGHSGYPWLGENANSLLIPALLALEIVDLPSSEKYGNSTLNLGRIEGGVAANVIAEEARADILIRIAEGSAEQTKGIVNETIKRVDERLEIRYASEGYGPVDINTDIKGSEQPFLPSTTPCLS